MYWLKWLVWSLSFVASVAYGQAPATQDDLDNMNHYKEEIKYNLEGFDEFAEQVDPWSLNLSIGHQDFLLPGNGGLDLRVSRYYQTPSRSFSHGSPYPYANQGKYVMGFGWNIHFGYITHSSWATRHSLEKNMQGMGKPLTGTDFTSCYDPDDHPSNYETFFMTTQSGAEERIAPAHSGNFMASKSGWRGGCATTGFIMYSPEGHKYIFDTIKFGAMSDRKTESRMYSYAWYVSRIEDKHGNWININYTNAEQAIIEYIDTNDGRRLDFTYTTIDNTPTLTKISSANKVIDYGYNDKRNLSSVKIGDRQLWHYSYQTYYEWYNQATIYLLKTLTTESGGLFSYEYIQGGRTYSGEKKAVTVSRRMTSGTLPESLTSYSIQVVPTVGFSPNKYGSGVTVIGDRRTHGTTTVVEDNRCTKSIFNDVDQGDWLAGTLAYKYTYQNSDCTVLLETEEYQWDQVKISNQSLQRAFYAYYVGYVGDVTDQHIWKAVLKEKVVNREGNIYITHYNDFTESGNPGNIIEFSSTGLKRTIENKYLNPGYQYGVDLPDTSSVKSNDGTVISLTDYDYDTAYNLSKKTINGKSNSYIYHPDGSLKKVTYDGGKRYDLLEDYYRGKALKVTLPCAIANGCDKANESTINTVILKKEVYSDGRTKSITDFRGNKVSYSYDGIGRLTKIDYADPKWADTNIAYGLVTTNEDGIVGSSIEVGSLRQTVTSGNFETVIYHDGLIRPVFIRTRDTTIAASDSYQRFVYNADGQQELVSYASASASNLLGEKTSYDALGRVISKTRTSDNSVISTIQYLANYEVVVTDGEDNITTTTFLEYGVPAYALPSLIVAPDTADTMMGYNAVGQITSITQSNITETRLYDDQLRLCKTVRPETGLTAYGYNSRHQLAWRAAGTSGSKTSCDDISVPASHKTVFSYDNLGQLRGENFPDSTPDKTYSYDANGNLTSLLAGAVNWSYLYNSRNAIDKETLTLDGKSFVLDWEYDSLGNVSSLKYPSGKTVAYSPNALGQATKAGSYATNIIYHPNGQIKQFTYGNGIVRNVELDATGRIDRITESKDGISKNDLDPSYDLNDNLAGLIDWVDRNNDIKNLVYDGADRLRSADGRWGSGSYSYDGLGNLFSRSLNNSTITYHYDSLNRLTHLSGAYAYNYGYDVMGNIIHNGRYSLSFNRGNQLASAKGINYVYDGHNRRVKKDADYSVYSKAGQLLHRQKANGDKTDSIYIGKQLIADVELRGGGTTGPTIVMSFTSTGGHDNTSCPIGFVCLTANPSPAEHILSWTTTGATSCSGTVQKSKDDLNTGSSPISGISNSGIAFTNDGTIYSATLTCIGSGGQTTENIMAGGNGDEY